MFIGVIFKARASIIVRVSNENHDKGNHKK